jgi:hypothetical protein
MWQAAWVLHDPVREVRVIGLGHHLETVVDDANDHGFSRREFADPELT